MVIQIFSLGRLALLCSLLLTFVWINRTTVWALQIQSPGKRSSNPSEL